MVVGPATVAKIANLKLQVFAKFGTSALSSIFFNFMLDLPRVQEIKLEEWNVQILGKFIVTILVSKPASILFLLF